MKMNQDYSKAVLFTNSYFVLADGLASGIENYLAKNVILDWFGKTITGRTNVAMFLNTHKVISKHVFKDIIPSDSIGYNKQSIARIRRRRSEALNNLSISGNISIENISRTESTPVNEIISFGDRSRSSSKINVGGNNFDDSDLKYELYDDELSNIFKLKNIKLTNVEEIEQKINQISLDEKSNLKLLCKNDCNVIGESNKIDLLESSIKYVQAQGEILFSKKSRRQSGQSDCRFASSTSSHTWRKPCKLQIAYSSEQICLEDVVSMHNNSFKFDNSSNLVNFKKKLLSKSNQITELNNQLSTNTNDLPGLFINNNLTKANDTFLENLYEYLSKNDANELGLVPKYVDDQLVFQKVMSDSHYDLKKSFIFNHLIHVIIYEGRSRCRRNLSQKFI